MHTLPVAEHCRVIVDNDWAGDPDGLVALAHHLLSPANRVVLVTSSFLNPMFVPLGDGAERGSRLALELVGLVGGPQPLVVTGSERPLSGAVSAAAIAIVEVARSADPLPLLLVCAGPLTNVAEALRLAPDIVGRLALVWVGGTLAKGEEYNRDTDPAAAEAVLGTPGLHVRRFPLETYRTCVVSLAELEHDLAGAGRVGAWLWERFVTLPLPPEVRLGGTWALGDSPPLLLTALTDASSTGVSDRPDHVVFTAVDHRLLLGDLLARLRMHGRST